MAPSIANVAGKDVMFDDLTERGKDMARRFELHVGLSHAQHNALPERDKVRNEDGDSWLRAAEYGVTQAFGADSPELERWKGVTEEFHRRAEYGPAGYLWRYAAFVALLQEFDFRLETGRRLQAPASAPGTVIHSYGGLSMQSGDTYNVSQSQVGALGHGAQATSNTMQQSLGALPAATDLAALAAELATLRHELTTRAVDPEQHVAVGQVAAAEVAARKGDAGKTAGYLKAAGAWALDTATKVGVTVASGALKHALGLP